MEVLRNEKSINGTVQIRIGAVKFGEGEIK